MGFHWERGHLARKNHKIMRAGRPRSQYRVNGYLFCKKVFPRKLLFLTLVLAALAACGEAFGALPPRFGGQYRVAIRNTSPQLLPARAVTDDELTLVGAIFEPLVKLNSKGAPAPLLLDKLPVESDDKLTYYFKLKDGVFFHNGKKLDAADVVFSIQEALKDRRAAYSWIFGNIAGAAEFRSGKSKSLDGLKVVDSLRFQIRLKKPDPDFIRLLTLPAAGITAAGIDHKKTPVGTGPFEWAEKKPGKEIVLNANARYHEGRPYLDSIVFRAVSDPRDAMLEYKTGRLDAVTLAPGAAPKPGADPTGTALKSPVKRIVFLDMNPKSPMLENVATRKQVAFAINRNSIISVILGGDGTPENFIPEAKKIKVSKIAEKAPAELWYLRDDPAHTFVAERLKVDLFAKMGIVVKLAGKDDSALYDDGKGAPAFRLGSLPLLSSMQKTVQSTLFNYANRSPFSAIMVRHEIGQADFDDVPVAFLYSNKRSVFVSNRFSAPVMTDNGGVDLSNVFLENQAE